MGTKDNKPMNSPNVKKWLDNGGTIDVGEVDGTKVWKYTTSTGESATYYDDNIVFSQENLHPDAGTVNIGSFSGNRSTDYRKTVAALSDQYDMTSVPAGYVVHHDVQNGVIQLVESGVHKTFTHIGGHSIHK